jgi:hypothetical protein
MGLFSILDPRASEGVAGAGDNHRGKRSSPSLDLPSIVQLYGTDPVRLESAALVPPHSMLSYSAVAVASGGADDEEGAEAAAAAADSPSKRSSKKAVQAAAKPELGVWNVRVPPRRSGDDSLLLLPPRPTQTAFCFVVDLSDPSRVEPTLTALQASLVRYLIARPPPPTDEPPPLAAAAATTTLHGLRTVTFGLAPDDAGSAARLEKGQQQAAADASEGDRRTRIALVVCARRRPGSPSLSTAPEGPAAGNAGSGSSKAGYRSKQTQALLFYHLRRYAAALDATLCFVEGPGGRGGGSAPSPADGGDGDGDDPEQPVVGAAQLGRLWLELASGGGADTEGALGDASGGGGPPHDDDGEGGSSAPSSPYAPIYTPSNHNPELIESVLLRSANYPGEWDAAKESLWKILPPGSDGRGDPGDEAVPAAAAGGAGDDEDRWLSELRDSAAAAAAPGPSDTATRTPAKAAAGPDKKEVATRPPDSAQKDAAVSSFFESLLK